MQIGYDRLFVSFTDQYRVKPCDVCDAFAVADISVLL